MGTMYLSSLKWDLAPYTYWKLGIHCLGLPGCNVYANKVPQIATFVGLGLNDDHRSTNHKDEDAQACICTYSVHSLV